MSEHGESREIDSTAFLTTGDADGEARLDRALRLLFEHLRALGPACT